MAVVVAWLRNMGNVRGFGPARAVCQGLTSDADAEFAHVGEVRQVLLARRVVLAEDHLALRPVLRARRAA